MSASANALARLHYGAALLLLLALLGWPPRQGALLLVPLGARARTQLLPLVVANGGRLLARGPIAGSMIVEGARDRLFPVLATAGIVTLASPAGGCGKEGIRNG